MLFGDCHFGMSRSTFGDITFFVFVNLGIANGINNEVLWNQVGFNSSFESTSLMMNVEKVVPLVSANGHDLHSHL